MGEGGEGSRLGQLWDMHQLRGHGESESMADKDKPIYVHMYVHTYVLTYISCYHGY